MRWQVHRRVKVSADIVEPRGIKLDDNVRLPAHQCHGVPRGPRRLSRARAPASACAYACTDVHARAGAHACECLRRAVDSACPRTSASAPLSGMDGRRRPLPCTNASRLLPPVDSLRIPEHFGLP